MARFTTALMSLTLAMLVTAGLPSSSYAAGACGNGNVQPNDPQLEECDDGDDIGGDGCSATCTIEPGYDCVGNPSVCTLIVCGNGITQTGEDCDGGPCCEEDCDFVPAETVCRASAGVCDTAEVCSGSASTCPADAKSGSVCRAAAGVCDFAEECDGVNNACPADGKLTSVCRAAAGICDVGAENCDGTNNDCPADVPQNAGTTCRASAGVCDPAEVCDGTSGACPADVLSTSVCRASAGVCDVAESCNGEDADCPSDAKSTDTCRGAAGVCDVAEECDGVSNSCPADAKSDDVCRPAVGNCDIAETCSGGNDCPAEVLADAGTTCRDSLGVCDPAEVCTGTTGTCPADVRSTSVCRGSAGVCDTEEVCNGDDADCPADAKSTDVCRPAVSPECDVEEVCDGTANNCPDDVLANGCDDDDGIACTEATCLESGECATADTCVEICRGAGFWQNHGGNEKGENILQDVLNDGSLEVCGQIIDETTDLGDLDSALEGLCVKTQGVKERQLYRQLLTAAINCAISEGGTCEQITARFMEVSYDECNALCAGDSVDEDVTLKRCKKELACFNGGGRIIDGECAKGTCAEDTELYCGGDFDDCPLLGLEEQDCVKFEDACTGTDLCSDELDSPASICPQSLSASSPKRCNDARQNSCTIDSCF